MAKASTKFEIEVSVSPATDPKPQVLADGFEITSVRKAYSDDQQIITCVAMAANEIDAHGDMFLPSAVKMAAHGFLAGYNVEKTIGKQHDPNASIDAELIGSFYTEEPISFDGIDAPADSWVTQIKISDSETWTEIKKSQRTGLSIQGPASGWIVDDDIEKSISAHLEKAKAGDSKFTKPKRVFAEASPTNLDVVDEGANLHLLVWKAKKMPEEKKTTETITTSVAKGKATEDITPAEPVAKTDPAPQLAPDKPDALERLQHSLQVAKALEGVDVPSALAQLETLAKAFGGKVSEPVAPAPAPVAAGTPEPAPAPTVDVAAEIAKALAPLQAELEEIKKAKVAQSSASDGDDDGADKTEADLFKSKFPNNKIDVDGTFAQVLRRQQ